MGLDSLKQQLDNTEYDIGIFKTANCKVKLRNDHGRYGSFGTIESIFKFKRGGSKMKIEWEPRDELLCCGFFNAGAPDSIVSELVNVFEGVLDDTLSKSPVDEQTVEFLIQGYESLLTQMKVPFASIGNTDALSLVIFTICNQAPLTTHVSVLIGNITLGIANNMDSKASLENKTATEALKEILLATNSVLYIKENVFYVKPRTEGATDAYTFYGWASFNGIENILDIDEFRLGENRIINFATWQDTTLFQQDVSSIGVYGYRKKEINLDVLTDNTKRNNVLTAIKDEFKNPKREFTLSCFIEPATIALFLLDKVVVDYPPEYVVTEDENVAIYGIGVYGVDFYADAITRLTIEDTARFKIMTRKIDFIGGTIQFGLREV